LKLDRSDKSALGNSPKGGLGATQSGVPATTEETGDGTKLGGKMAAPHIPQGPRQKSLGEDAI